MRKQVGDRGPPIEKTILQDMPAVGDQCSMPERHGKQSGTPEETPTVTRSDGQRRLDLRCPDFAASSVRKLGSFYVARAERTRRPFAQAANVHVDWCETARAVSTATEGAGL